MPRSSIAPPPWAGSNRRWVGSNGIRKPKSASTWSGVPMRPSARTSTRAWYDGRKRLQTASMRNTPVGLRRRGHPADLGGVQRHRLLAQDVLSGLEVAPGVRLVARVRRRHVDHVDVGVLGERLLVLVPGEDVELVTEGVGPLDRSRRHRHDLTIVHVAHRPGETDGDPPRPDDAPTDHGSTSTSTRATMSADDRPMCNRYRPGSTCHPAARRSAGGRPNIDSARCCTTSQSA